MDVSIVIVNYCSAQMVIDCIHSIFDNTIELDYEIIVVDNASGDGSVERIKSAFGKKIKMIESAQNLGFGKANNLGAQKATGRYLFLLNPDTLIIDNSIRLLYNYIKKCDEIGVVGGNLYSPDMSPAPSYCMEFDDLDTERKRASWNEILRTKIGQKLRNRLKKEAQQFSKEFNYSNEPKKVAYIFGADMMIKKTLFEELQGFDSDFFMYGEEEEFSWRITKKGYSIINIPDSKIIHLEGATLKSKDEFSERQFRMRMNGTLTYFWKRFGLEGAKQFYTLRSLRYNRLIKIAKLQNKLTDTFVPLVQKRCLDEVYQEFMNQRN